MQEIDAQFIERHFAATAPRPSRMTGFYALIGVVAAFVLVWAFRAQSWHLVRPLVLGLPWLVLLLLLAVSWWTTLQQRQRRRMITKAEEHVQLEAWEQAERTLEPALQSPIRSSNDRCQAFMVLAALAEHNRQYESAARIYQTLLLERIGEGYQLQRVQLGLSSAKLRNEELADAVNLLDRLEKISMPPALQAVCQLIRLSQQVFMGHYEDAVENMADRQSLFRRFLSTKAGYGYGLLAAAHHRLGRLDEAARLWLDATTLVHPERLVEEYDCLAVVSQNYPALEQRS
ncbi:MAG: hypothetical protein MI923_22325 [Phycisphaerales bacterium]|nr:hypothetical protein [Phycisphaerales bacterium]